MKYNFNQQRKLKIESILLIAIVFSVFVGLTQSFSTFDTVLADATQELTSWTMRVRNQSYASKVPASAIQNLIDHGVLPKNFYYRDNFLKAYEYETQDFIYDATFLVSAPNLNTAYHTIIFQGLDTHCQVILNGQKILQSHNMYRRYEIDVRLKNINNITVKFNSSAKYDQIQEAKFYTENGFNLPQNYSFTRKAAYQYGWDWGPRILSVGIWKPVIINFYKQSKFRTFEFNQLTPIDKDTTIIQTETRVVLQKMDPTLSYQVQITIANSNQTKTLNYFAANVTGNSTYQISSQWNLTNSPNITLNDYIWWTWDLGTQSMIKIILTVTNIKQKIHYTKSLQTGLRTVILNQTKSYNGTSFTINLNGYDLYMRGGNYIPPQMSLARTNATIYQTTIRNAREQNFNMLRVWGGGQFQKDWFYQECDKAGILIWHDLMFACALYPYNQQIDSNIQAQMLDNLKRLKHHPSIGLWNGNNQVWIGWQEWGWKNNKTQVQKQKVEQMYAGVFQKVLPSTINKITPNIPYWETSPSVSSNHAQTISSGDIHFWRVWGAGTPIQQYRQFVGRFNSQYGMQSMPDISTIQKFTNSQDRQSLNSYVLRLHQRHPKGDQYLPMYVNNYTGQTQNLTRFSYFSQVMQAYALGLAISSLRGSKPFNMGSLYWQLNDVWPVSSWATIDYYQAKKAAHYAIKKLYQPLLINCYQPYTQNVSNSSYSIHIINDYNRQFNADTKISIQKFNGQVIYSQTIKGNPIQSFQNLLISQLPKAKYQNIEKDCFVCVEMNYTQKIKSQSEIIYSIQQIKYQRNVFFPVKPKDRNIIDPKLRYSLNVSSKTITISVENIATYVWIYGLNGTQSTGYTHFVLTLQNDQNYMTLLPNQSKTFKILYQGDFSTLKFGVTSYELQILRQSGKIFKNLDRQSEI